MENKKLEMQFKQGEVDGKRCLELSITLNGNVLVKRSIFESTNLTQNAEGILNEMLGSVSDTYPVKESAKNSFINILKNVVF